jgi:phospholipase/carboxylesterase
MAFEAVEHRTFSARIDCHYLLQAPPAADAPTLLVAALHGFGSNPEVMLRLTEGLLGSKHVIAAVQAPNQFFLSQTSNEVGYCWATHKHSDSSVRLHHEMLLYVLDEVGRQYGIPAERRLLVGFSQPVGMNYRFSATHPGAVRGVIGICGGVPRNWEDGPYRKISAALLHIARREDEFYAPAVTEKYGERLRLRANDVEFHMLDGAHRFPSKAGPIVERWIERTFARRVE